MNYDELEQQFPDLESIMEDDPHIEILDGTFSNGATLRYVEYLDNNKKPVTKSRATQAFIIERDDNHTVLYKGFQALHHK